VIPELEMEIRNHQIRVGIAPEGEVFVGRYTCYSSIICSKLGTNGEHFVLQNQLPHMSNFLTDFEAVLSGLVEGEELGWRT